MMITSCCASSGPCGAAMRFAVGTLHLALVSSRVGVAGSIDGSSGVAGAIDFGLVRYTVDGQPDATFGAGGTIVTDFSGNADVAWTVAIQPDGMIVAAGSTGTFPTAQFALARYNGNGSADANFGSGGTGGEAGSPAFAGQGGEAL